MKGTRKLKRILAAAAAAMTVMLSATAMAAADNEWGSNEWNSPVYVENEWNSVWNTTSGKNTTSGSQDSSLWIIEERTGHTYVKGSLVSVTITCNGEFSKFRSVYVDGVLLEDTNYTAAEGSTVLTLMPEYLETLPVGTHTVTLNYTYGSADSLLHIAESDAASGNVSDKAVRNASAGNSAAPATGDTSAILLWPMAALASGCYVILSRRKRTDDR